MTDLLKACAQVISNPSFIQGLICGVSLFLVPKVVTYISRKKHQKAKRSSERDDDDEDEDDDDEDDDDSDGFEDIDSADEDDSEDMEEMKLMLIVRTDLGMGKGKAAAQCAHAAVQAYRQASVHAKKRLQTWCRYGQRKVVVKVDNEAELLRLAAESRKRQIITSLVTDAGRTQVESGSRTVLGIGPATPSELDVLTGHLKLY